MVKAARPRHNGRRRDDGRRRPFEELRRTDYPFSALKDNANVLVFPDLEAANVAYKLLQHLGKVIAAGPILMGMAWPVHILSRGADVSDIVNMAAIAVVDAQEHERRRTDEVREIDLAGMSDR